MEAHAMQLLPISFLVTICIANALNNSTFTMSDNRRDDSKSYNYILCAISFVSSSYPPPLLVSLFLMLPIPWTIRHLGEHK